MKSVILLNSNENTRQVEDEEKTRFVRSVLDSIGIPLENIWDDDGILSVENKIKLRSVLSVYNIKIIDDSDGGLRLYVDQDLVGEWKKCQYVLKKDLSEIDPSKKLYLEMHVDYWSVFENTE
jgi:hypothetical protein